MAQLVIIAGPAQGRSFDLEERSEIVVGRDADCTFQVLDEQISRHHLSITRAGDGAPHVVADRASVNGVMLNGARLNGAAALDDGDLIEIGSSSLVYTTRAASGDGPTVAELKKLGEDRRRTQRLW